MRMMTRVLLVALFAASASAAYAQEYPTKPIRVLVTFAPGGVTDVAARLVTLKLTETLGWRFVVDNRPGASGFIAVGIAAKAEPDGYTLLMAAVGEFAINPAIFSKIPYDLDRDFTPITMVSESPLVMVAHIEAPIRTYQDLIARAKSEPGRLAYASAGNGSPNHLAGEWLATATGIKLVHVPYKGGAPAAGAVAGGEVMIGVVSIAAALSHLKAGRIRVIGLTTQGRSALTPEWSSAKEGGVPGLDATIWVGLFAPKGVPKPIIAKLYSEIAKVLKMPDVRERFAVTGAETVGMRSTDFHARIKADAERYKKIAQAAGLKPE
ncbi:MAG: tripartite tricarboxylate transporter substrate binding protein [Betaproteobacteria bacterium]|nr:tripartite tricarboxylate transporter substrate binding protein [Betaproteobacteria bacterium]